MRTHIFVWDAHPHRTTTLTGVIQVELSALGVVHD
jgi:hypothetical protein